MQIVEALDDATVYDSSGQFAYSLRGGRRYLLYDREVGLGLHDDALELVGGIDQRLPMYNGGELQEHRLILPFIGRQGDAIVTASCLAALTGNYPAITVDVACMSRVRATWELMPTSGELLEYPLEAEQLSRYDYYLSFEEIEAVPHGGKRSCVDVFSACLRTPHPLHSACVIVPQAAQDRWKLASTSRACVAIHVGLSGSLRSYPLYLVRELTDRLVQAGFDVYLVGTDDVLDDGILPATVHDLIGKTPTPADLAAVLGQMQAVVTCDSFPLHLAGALGVPTLAIFTSTDAIIGSDYPSVISWQSDAKCSPCRLPDGPCSLGHGECVAHRASSLSPQRIVEHLRSVVCAESVAGE